MSKRFILIIILLMLNLWTLHGMDLEYQTIRFDKMFDINLYLAVMTDFIIVLLLFSESVNYKYRYAK